MFGVAATEEVEEVICYSEGWCAIPGCSCLLSAPNPKVLRVNQHLQNNAKLSLLGKL